MYDLSDLLSRIQAHLAEGMNPIGIIEELAPRSSAEATAFGRRLPLWEEYAGQFSPQVVGIARVLSRRGLRQFGLGLSPEGHVVETSPKQKGRVPPIGGASRHFQFQVGNETVNVEYFPDYFPNSEQSLVTFCGLGEPPRPHALSPTGYWSHFTSRDAVDACGGAEAYAAMLAQAMLRGQQNFDAVFHGKEPETTSKRRKPATTTAGNDQSGISSDQDADTYKVVGPHSAQVTAGDDHAEEPKRPYRSKQRFLF